MVSVVLLCALLAAESPQVEPPPLGKPAPAKAAPKANGSTPTPPTGPTPPRPPGSDTAGPVPPTPPASPADPATKGKGADKPPAGNGKSGEPGGENAEAGSPVLIPKIHPRATAATRRKTKTPAIIDVDGSERLLPSTPAPSIGASALRNEVRLGSAGGAPPPDSERARLEQLAADIAKARDALRQDTARLEALLKGRGGMSMGDGVEGAAPAVPAKDLSKEQIDTVSKALKGMKPEQAGAIIARLDRQLAVEILRRMRPADAGAVLAQLKPELAAELMTELARKPPEKKGEVPR